MSKENKLWGLHGRVSDLFGVYGIGGVGVVVSALGTAWAYAMDKAPQLPSVVWLIVFAAMAWAIVFIMGEAGRAYRKWGRPVTEVLPRPPPPQGAQGGAIPWLLSIIPRDIVTSTQCAKEPRGPLEVYVRFPWRLRAQPTMWAENIKSGLFQIMYWDADGVLLRIEKEAGVNSTDVRLVFNALSSEEALALSRAFWGDESGDNSASVAIGKILLDAPPALSNRFIRQHR